MGRSKCWFHLFKSSEINLFVVICYMLCRGTRAEVGLMNQMGPPDLVGLSDHWRTEPEVWYSGPFRAGSTC